MYIRNQIFQKFKETIMCTFQPNLDRPGYLNRSNSRTTGKFYERCINWKQNQQKWIEEQRKLQDEIIQKEINDNHVETKRYSKRVFANTSRNVNPQLT